MHVLLERYRDADVVCVQEPCWTFVKNIASSTRKDGDPTYHTAHHRNFITLGATESSRVVVFVHRARWASASPRVRSAAIRHDDVLCVSMNLAGREMSFLNIYNDSRTHAGVTAALDRAAELPPITFLAGDFNLRHPMWDRQERRRDQPGQRHLLRRQGRAADLISLATDHLGLVLVNDPDGPPTWYSNNLGVREGVLDLMWADPDVGPIPPLLVRDLAWHDSDHAVLEWTLPVYAAPTVEPRVARGSANAGAFVRMCADGLRDVGDSLEGPIVSREGVNDVADRIEAVFRNAWHKCATAPKPCSKSKSWWNEECSTLAGDIRALRVKRKLFQHTRTGIRQRMRRAAEAPPAQWVEDAGRLTAMLRAQDERIARLSRRLKGAVRRARAAFFRNVINETEPSKIWSLVGWTKPRAVEATAGIVGRDGRPVESQEELGQAFQEQFTPANPRPVDMSLLDEFPQLPERPMAPISAAEIREALAGTGNFSAAGPDHIGWYWLKQIIGHQRAEGPNCAHNGRSSADPGAVLALVTMFFNACVKLGAHPRMFKVSRTVVIPKPNKPDYTKAKAYRPIVLLNCLGKLLEKILAWRLQFEGQKLGLLHPCQFGGTMQHSTVDAGVQLVHNIRQAWKASMDSSALLLDVSQFFPSINHGMLAGILRKQGFAKELCEYFDDYLVGRRTQFHFNGATLPPQDLSTGVGQGSSLSPVLTALFLAPVLHLVAATKSTTKLRYGDVVHEVRHDWTPRQMKANGHATVQFFVDDGLIHVAGRLAPGAEPEDQLKFNNVLLRELYGRLEAFLARAGLGVEEDKLELMHFTHRRRRQWSERHPKGPPLRIKSNGKLITVNPASTMRYLGFFLDPTLSFKEHVRFYATKGCSTVQALRMLGNSKHGMEPRLRRVLYLSNVVPLLTYGSQLWWSPSWKGAKGFAKTLQQAQSRAARWITGAFRTTPIGLMEAVAGLLPIRAQVDKYARRACLRARTLHDGHPTRANLPPTWTTNSLNISAPFALSGDCASDATTPLSHVDAVASAECHEEFDATHDECQPGQRLVDAFAGQITMYLVGPKKGTDAFFSWLRNDFKPRLHDNLAAPNAIVLFTDGSVCDDPDSPQRQQSGAGYVIRHTSQRGTVATSRARLGCGNVTPFDAELFALARGVTQACRKADERTKEIHIYTDNIAAIGKVLNPAIGPSQLCAILASRALRLFLQTDAMRRVTLHWCPGHQGIPLNEEVDALAKAGASDAQPAFTSLARAKQVELLGQV